MSVYKYSDWSFGQVEALLNVVGEDNARALISGELTLEKADNAKLQMKPAPPQPFFGRQGYPVVPSGLRGQRCTPNTSFYIAQPQFRQGGDNPLSMRLVRANFQGVLAGDLDDKALLLRDMLAKDPRTVNILKRPHVLLYIPPMNLGLDPASPADAPFSLYGARLDDTILLQVKEVYERHYHEPQRTFTNYRAGELAGQVTVLPESRHNLIVERLKSEPVIGLYFPDVLHGWSPEAQRNLIPHLPDGFSLAAPVITAYAFIEYPDVMARDGNTPYYDCSAVQWRSADDSLEFGAGGGGAGFGGRRGLGVADDGYAGGLFFSPR